MTERKSISHKLRVYLFQKQEGKCTVCGEELRGGNIAADHIQGLQFDGDNDPDNWQLICIDPCHKQKTAAESRARAKIKRLRWGRPRKSAPMVGTKASGWKKKLDGTVERR